MTPHMYLFRRKRKHVNMENKTQEQPLNESLAALRRFKESRGDAFPILHGDKTLGVEHTRRLLESRHLGRITGEWYFITYRDHFVSDWYRAFWHFVAAYCGSMFGEDGWVLAADDSLLFRAGGGVIPRHLTVRSGCAENTFTWLPGGHELVEVRGSDPAEPCGGANIETEPRYGVRLYGLNRALLTASPGFWREHPTDARTCLAMVQDTGGLVDLALRKGLFEGACRVAGGLRSIGNPWYADYIMGRLRESGRRLEEENPFSKDIAVPMETCAVATRMRLMWRSMRPAVLEAKGGIAVKPVDRTPGEILRMTAEAYPEDIFNSLGLDGYTVDKEAAEKARSDPEFNPEDWGHDLESSCATLGYARAFDNAVSRLLNLMTGGSDGAAWITDGDFLVGLFDYLTYPVFNAGVWDWEELVFWYRATPFHVRNSRHIPPEPGALDRAMDVFRELFTGEGDAFVRAVMGHFLIAWLHPFQAGNGLVARLLMNTQLVAGGYPWTVIPEMWGKEYFAALEDACVELDISVFARLMAEYVDSSGGTED